MSMKDISEFHKRFDIEEPGEPSFLPDDMWRFQVGFLQEEIRELRDAHAEGDMQGAADALVDLVYVALGTAYKMGLAPHWEEIWDNVQRANMAKVKAENAEQSKRGYAGDIVKPQGWKAPDHSKQLGKGPWKTRS